MPQSTKKIIINQEKTVTQMLVHNKFCTNIIHASGGNVIKELGDAVLVIFPSIPSACQCALNIIDNLKKHGKGICTKVTITAGTVERVKTRCEPDIYGAPVNLCNRMSKWVDPDSILIEENRYGEVAYWLSADPKIKFCKPTRKDLKEFGNRVLLRKITLKN